MNHNEPNSPHSRSGHDPCGYSLPGGGINTTRHNRRKKHSNHAEDTAGGGTDRQRSRSGRSGGTGYAAALRKTQRAEDTQEDARKSTNA